MNQQTPFPQLRAQAIALRRAGKSRREIADILHITSHDTLSEALRGEPSQPWTRRPNAKDDSRSKARNLREQGLDYEEIVAELGVSKSSVSLWVRDMPRPERLTEEEWRKRSLEVFGKYWAAERPIRGAAQQAVVTAAIAEIGRLSDREVLIAGAIAYWCEGSKNKPYRRIDRVAFINSDPALICLFIRFLAVAGIDRDRLTCRVYIHESADVEAGSGWTSRDWILHSSSVRLSNGTGRRQSGRTQATTTTAACASMLGAALSCTARSRAGRPPR